MAEKIGCWAETLRKWVRQAERDAGTREGVTSDERERLEALEKEDRERKRANAILREEIRTDVSTRYIAPRNRRRRYASSRILTLITSLPPEVSADSDVYGGRGAAYGSDREQENRPTRPWSPIRTAAPD